MNKRRTYEMMVRDIQIYEFIRDQLRACDKQDAALEAAAAVEKFGVGKTRALEIFNEIDAAMNPQEWHEEVERRMDEEARKLQPDSGLLKALGFHPILILVKRMLVTI